MKEESLLTVIKSTIGNKYIGDDCAYLKDIGIVITQDSLVEDIHFSLKYSTPYQLGYKSAMVNISDIAASGGRSKYITVGLSLPKNISENFVHEFYKGLKDALGQIEIVGGDITGSDKIMISICAIGTTEGRKISSRANAKKGQVVVTSGVHGSSAGGLKLLMQGQSTPKELINAHLYPTAQIEFAQKISENIKENYAMIDTSDGLADALFKIAQTGNKTLSIDFEKILYDEPLKKSFPDSYKDLILYGGEDYQIIATIPESLANKYNFRIIGRVENRKENAPVIIKNYDNNDLIIDNIEKCFNHFE